jgi:hypothetical protein
MVPWLLIMSRGVPIHQTTVGFLVEFPCRKTWLFQGLTPLAVAVCRDNDEVIKLLLQQ